MAGLNPMYFVTSDVDTYFVDKDTGLPLANGTLTFYRDSARNTPKSVFELSGAPPNYTYTSMGAQITLSAVGTVQDAGANNEVIYYFPYDDQGNLDLYYVVCEDQNGVQQFTREAWPNVSIEPITPEDDSPFNNQISNPTFTNIFINPDIPTIFTVTAATNQIFPIGPDWVLVVSGTGTITVQQVPIAGTSNVPTSPPYVLDIIVSVGITLCNLRQRFFNNSGLWASTLNSSIYLSASFVAENQVSGSAEVEMFYAASSGASFTSPILILDGIFQNSYIILMGGTANPIPASSDSNLGENAYVDIFLSFVNTGVITSHVRISSIQLIASFTPFVPANPLPYDLNSSNRNETHQADYYIPRLNHKQISSYLIGWDFPLNPFQFGISGTLGTSTAYIADQTIACSTSSGGVSYALDPVTNGLNFVSTDANGAFYILQYLTGDIVERLLGNNLSSNVFAYQIPGTANTTMRIYLFQGNSATIPTVPAIPASSLVTLNDDGTVTLTASNWSAVPRNGLPIPQVTTTIILSDTDIYESNVDYGFNGWQIPASNSLNAFAMVVTFAYTHPSSIIINSVSLVPGDIPCRPAIQSVDQVLSECQYYYETSYDLGVAPGTVTNINQLIRQQITPQVSPTTPGVTFSYNLTASSFDFHYNTLKRTIPNISIYSPNTGTLATLLGSIASANNPSAATGNLSINNWTPTVGTRGASYIRANGNILITLSVTYAGTGFVLTILEGYISFHYVADARLGVV
jgi:hypothetical protein